MNQAYIEKKFQEAEKNRGEGRYEAALMQYSEVLQSYPGSWLSYYGIGDIRLRSGHYFEAVNAFSLAWIHSIFRIEPGLMLARSMLSAKLTLSACSVFEKLPLDKFDRASLICYADALRQEGRIREALNIGEKELIEDQSLSAKRVLGDLYLEMNWLDKAEAQLKPIMQQDVENTYAHDRMLSIALSKNDWAELKMVVGSMQARSGLGYGRSVLVACDHLVNGIEIPKEEIRANDRSDILDAAQELKKHKQERQINITGNSYQTFEILKPIVLNKGLILEFGVRNGHTIHGLAELFPDRKIYGFDSFEGLPESWHDESAGSYTTGGRIPKVPENVEFVVGWFKDTLPGFKRLHPEPIAFMNVDCDLYSATKTVLEELTKQIVPGTVIVFDEYVGNKSWRQDEFKAFQEWVKAHDVCYEYLTASFYTKQVSVRILESNG